MGRKQVVHVATLPDLLSEDAEDEQTEQVDGPEMESAARPECTVAAALPPQEGTTAAPPIPPRNTTERFRWAIEDVLAGNCRPGRTTRDKNNVGTNIVDDYIAAMKE